MYFFTNIFFFYIVSMGKKVSSLSIKYTIGYKEQENPQINPSI